jgi:DNA gyrase subunit B
MLSLVEPKFSGQTKDKLTNRKAYFDKFIPQFKSQLEEVAKYNEDTIKLYLERFQDYRRKLDAKKLTRTGSISNRASTKFTKLRDCSSRLGELFIVEGDSAGGSIIQSRDPRKHAVLPLKGKSIPNVTTKKTILENKEVTELIKAIGTGVGPHFDLSKLRYSKIVCATDADFDGAHIACLVTMAMAILLPDIVKAGKFFIASTPLFAINEKKLFKPLWNEKELEKARAAGKTIQRYKGLGEMNPNELKISLLDEATRNLMPITYSKNIDSLIKLFSSAEEKRKLVS